MGYCQEFYNKHKEKGLCVYCYRQAVPGKTRCEHHRNLCNHNDKENYKKKKANGLCVKCGNQAVFGEIMCEHHRNQHSLNAKRRYKYNSEKHLGRVKKRRDRLRKEGFCYNCGKPLDIDADRGMLCCINCREHVNRTNRRNYAIAN